MPIYEYYCPDNHKVYQFFARSSCYADTIPTCPDNPDFRMVRKVSGFAIGGAEKKSATDGGEEGSDLDDPKRMAAMAEMERAVSGMDEDHPDPKQMGKLMRQMAEMTGESLSGEMEEMVRKLEEGANPEDLEAQFGDFLGAEERADSLGSEGDPGEVETPAAGGGAFRGPPRRDETLYEFD